MDGYIPVNGRCGFENMNPEVQMDRNMLLAVWGYDDTVQTTKLGPACLSGQSDLHVSL